MNKITYDLASSFNNFCLRELHLEVSDDRGHEGHIIDDDGDNVTLIKFNGKFLKITEYEGERTSSDEIEVNLLKDTSLMRFIFGMFIERYAKRHASEVSLINEFGEYNKPGEVGITITNGSGATDIISDTYSNLCVRFFSLITKINGTYSMYTNKLKQFDIIEEQ